MRVAALAAVHLPTVSKALKPFALPASGPPKIRAVKITPQGDKSLHVAHMLKGGGTKTFSFASPQLMGQHLKRIEKNAWLKPMQDNAPRIVKTLDLGGLP